MRMTLTVITILLIRMAIIFGTERVFGFGVNHFNFKDFLSDLTPSTMSKDGDLSRDEDLLRLGVELAEVAMYGGQVRDIGVEDSLLAKTDL